MNNDTLTQFRNELACVAASFKKCEGAYKGLRAFKNSPQGLAFCAVQLLKDAAMLRYHAEQLAAIAEDLHNTLSVVAQPGAAYDATVDGHP